MSDDMGFSVEIVNDPTEINLMLGANYLPGELLRWQDMELAKAEVNANRDRLTAEDITALAETLPLMPLLDGHNSGKVVGIFTAARHAEGDRLLTDGIIYARRFPDTAQAILEGSKRPSIEAFAPTAVCSICGGEFSSSADYCEHLRNKHASGAVRWFKGIKAVGGAVVPNPADKTAKFDMNAIYMVAEHEEADDMESDAAMWTFLASLYIGDDDYEGDIVEAAKKKWAQDVDLDEGSLSALGWPSGEKIARAIESGKVSYAKAVQKLNYLANVSKDSDTVSKAKSIMKMLKNRFGNKAKGGSMEELEAVKAQLDEALQKLEALDELEATNADLQSQVEELTAEVDKFKAEAERLREESSALREQNRKMVLASVLSDEEFEERKEVIMAMSDEAVELLASKATPPPEPAGDVKTNLDDDEDDGISL